nr:DnaA regulatory inactivator Hda [Parahaliea mediterranea]
MALNVQLRDDATLENFLPTAALAPLVALLEVQLEAGGEPVIYLYGGAGTGKSHLLQACCHRAQAPALYLPLAELREHPPEAVLAGTESMALVCLDDIDAVQGDADWERALFHFFNRARDAGCRLLIAADASPRGLAVQLADLRSRLSWGVVYHLPGYDDEQKEALLAFRAARKGLQMPAEVARYIVSRAPRGLAELLALLDRLDRLSLAEQRALTVPFVKRALGW